MCLIDLSFFLFQIMSAGTSSLSDSSVPSYSGRLVTSTPARVQTPNGQAILEAVIGGKVSLHQIAIDWLERYEEDRGGALLQLTQFIFLSTGCPGQITVHMSELEPQELVAVMAEPKYWQESSIQGGKKLISGLGELLKQIVHVSRHSILFDGIYIDKLVTRVL